MGQETEKVIFTMGKVEPVNNKFCLTYKLSAQNHFPDKMYQNPTLVDLIPFPKFYSKKVVRDMQ